MHCHKKILFKIRYSRIPRHMHLRITTQPGSVTVEKLAGIFTKRIWQPNPTVIRRPGYCVPLDPSLVTPLFFNA